MQLEIIKIFITPKGDTMDSLLTCIKNGYYISKEVFSSPQTHKRPVYCYELEWITTDGFTSVINDTEYTQKYGNILVASPGDTRRSIGYFECYYIHFTTSDSSLRSVLSSFPKVFRIIDSEKIEILFRDMAQYPRTNAGYSMFCKAKILEILSCLQDNLSISAQKRQYERYVRNIFDARRYMDLNFGRAIRLADVAAKAYLSPGFFHKVFKELVNMTPSEYLLSVRLSHAEDLLINSGESIESIALSCGFSGQSYFSYVFRIKNNETPGHFRKRKRPVL